MLRHTACTFERPTEVKNVRANEAFGPDVVFDFEMLYQLDAESTCVLCSAHPLEYALGSANFEQTGFFWVREYVNISSLIRWGESLVQFLLQSIMDERNIRLYFEVIGRWPRFRVIVIFEIDLPTIHCSCANQARLRVD